MAQRDKFSEFDQDAPNPDEAFRLREENTNEESATVPKSRFDEVVAQRDELHGQREEMIKSMLNGPQQAPQEVQEGETPIPEDVLKPIIPEGTDPDVAAVLTPILEANNKAVYEGLQANMAQTVDRRVAPVEDRVNFADMVDSVANRVEGFNEVRKDIVQMLERMSPEERMRYDGEMGLEALAHRALRERGERYGSRSDMAHTASFGATSERPQRREATEADIWALSDEEFERELAKKGMSL